MSKYNVTNLTSASECSWLGQNSKGAGPYQTQAGEALTGFYFKDFKKIRHAISLFNGYLQSKYSYPLVEIPFSSPMHNWDNLYFCGGYSTDCPDGQPFDTDERLVTLVLERKKPMGFIVIKEAEAERFIQMVEGRLEYRVKPSDSREGYVELGVSNKGKISELFDIKSLITSYQLLEDAMGEWWGSETAAAALNGIATLNLEDFLDFEYASPENEIDYVIIGLILGYPMESTYALLGRTVS